MSETTKIQWTDHTFNPWEGCTKVSPGCAHCYAEARNQRFAKGANWGKGAPRRRTIASNWKEPLKWNRGAVERRASSVEGRRPRVFCASLADWLDDEVPIEWLADLLKLIHDTPNLDWQLLTKRPQNFFERLDACGVHGSEVEDWIEAWTDGRPPSNVWIGATVEDQQRADERIPQLLAIPANVRFLSCEPLLGPVDFEAAFRSGGAGASTSDFALRFQQHQEWERTHGREGMWAIFGGESGPKARPCNIEWIRDGVRQCKAAGVPVFVKQLGATPIFNRDEGRPIVRDKKGGDMDEWPEDLRVRQFPA